MSKTNENVIQRRTNYCGLINEQYLNQTVTVVGWVHKRRDLGGVIFFDIRDREGLLQVIIEPDNIACVAIGNTIRHEYVVTVTGTVRNRLNANPQLKTGQIELLASAISILNPANPIPILIDDETTSETNRMIHRVIDLRSSKMQHNLRLRHQVTMAIRNFLDSHGFIDIETPFLTRSTPEGARDFLVPSRLNKGDFYALPQSPQLFKQLLMIAGFDRYYQIVKCFRDEDLRADRQPEFTQIDIETSFLPGEDIRDLAETMICALFKQVLNVEWTKFPVITYAEAMRDYGSDKPDLRIPLKFIDLTTSFKNSAFKVFSNVANLADGRIVALNLPPAITISRKEMDTYTELVASHGAKGLAYIKVNDINKLNEEGLQSPITKFLTQDELRHIMNATHAETGCTLLFIADKTTIANNAMGALRLKVGHSKNLIACRFAPLWVVDFPMFEYSEEDQRYVACHHPFTAPHDEHIALLKSNPEQCLAKAYDMVLNGAEIGGGSVRIHTADVQTQVFTALGISQAEAKNKFGFLLDNLQYGTPPHGGIAFGLDRITAIMCHAESIREVIAFPKTTKGQCLLTNAPNAIDAKQLAELDLALNL